MAGGIWAERGPRTLEEWLRDLLPDPQMDHDDLPDLSRGQTPEPVNEVGSNAVVGTFLALFNETALQLNSSVSFRYHSSGPVHIPTWHAICIGMCFGRP